MANRTGEFGFSAQARRTHAQPISYLLAEALNNPSLICLAAGLVDYETLPADEIRRLTADLLADPVRAQAALQYGTTKGLAELRHLLLAHVADLEGVGADELGLTAEQVIITTGSQQLLALLCNVLIDPGDIVITAWPSYFVYTGTLASFGAEIRGVDIDEGGMIPEALEATLARLADEGLLGRVKLVYVQSYHQNPTGITLAPDRRPALLEIVRAHSHDHRILLLEDAAYRELTYEGQPPPSIKSYDTDNRFVALAQTFSKPFAPGVRTGYALLPADLVEPVILQKSAQDFGSCNLMQHLCLEAIKSGTYQRHLQALRRRYAEKRGAMLTALAQHLGDLAGITWTRPSGGMYVYVTLPADIDTGRDGPLFAKAMAEGVLYVPGEYCFGPDPTRTPPHNTVRLSFGEAPIADIRNGVAKFASAVGACLDR